MNKKNNTTKLINIKNIILGIFLLIGIGFFTPCEIFGQISSKKSNAILENNFYKGSKIRIKILKEDIVRIQIAPESSEFHESGLNRYKFIQEPNTNNLKVKFSESKNGFSATTSLLKIKGNSKTGEIVISDPFEKKIFLKQIAANFGKKSSNVVFKADKKEDWIGFGDQSRDRLYQRGYIADCFC